MSSPQRVGIVGLGLIGGSFARAYAQAPHWDVFVEDINHETQDLVERELGVSALERSQIAGLDLLVLAAYPAACLDWMRRHLTELANTRASGLVVVDVAGVKQMICSEAFALAEEHGFHFCGTHPMAGTHFSGFAHARANLFQGAPLVLVPPCLSPAELQELIERTTSALEPLGFGQVSITTPHEHDRIIAFTSQLAHVVSNAYIKSPTSRSHLGFSAGSYKDLTRVAHLNPAMWSELMCANAEALSFEVGSLIQELEQYKRALDAQDEAALQCLLAEGDAIKRTLDASEEDD